MKHSYEHSCFRRLRGSLPWFSPRFLRSKFSSQRRRLPLNIGRSLCQELREGGLSCWRCRNLGIIYCIYIYTVYIYIYCIYIYTVYIYIYDDIYIYIIYIYILNIHIWLRLHTYIIYILYIKIIYIYIMHVNVYIQMAIGKRWYSVGIGGISNSKTNPMLAWAFHGFRWQARTTRARIRWCAGARPQTMSGRAALSRRVQGSTVRW